jgi:hypothetical protein
MPGPMGAVPCSIAVSGTVATGRIAAGRRKADPWFLSLGHGPAFLLRVLSCRPRTSLRCRGVHCWRRPLRFSPLVTVGLSRACPLDGVRIVAFRLVPGRQAAIGAQKEGHDPARGAGSRHHPDLRVAAARVDVRHSGDTPVSPLRVLRLGGSRRALLALGGLRLLAPATARTAVADGIVVADLPADAQKEGGVLRSATPAVAAGDAEP